MKTLKQARYQQRSQNPYQTSSPTASHNTLLQRCWPARNGIKPLNSRHRLDQISKKSKYRDQNTVILPHVDVEADLEAIRTGRAEWNTTTSRYTINGRHWAVKANGTVFPDSGEGFENLNRSQYIALMELIECKGSMDTRPQTLKNDPKITDSDWRRAASVYRYHPHNAGEMSES